VPRLWLVLPDDGRRPNPGPLDELLARWLYGYMAQEKDDSETDSVFRALADPTRRRILRDLRKTDLAAGDIASHFPISGPSVSRHLAVLKAAGLATERRQANKVIYSLAPERLRLTVGAFLSAVCPDDTSARSPRKKKSKAADKGAGKDKGKPSGTGHAGQRAGARAKSTPAQEETGPAAAHGGAISTATGISTGISTGE
jgi:DNA-binding transcriptional ArsR family regulator